MQVDLRGGHAAVAEKLGDLIQAPTGIGQVAPESVPQLVRRHRFGEAGAFGRRPQQLVDRIGAPNGSRNRFTNRKSPVDA